MENEGSVRVGTTQASKADSLASPTNSASPLPPSPPSLFKIHALDGGDQAKLLAHCENFVPRFIATVLLDTGIRVSELAALKPENVDWERNQLEVGEGRNHRFVPLATPRVKNCFHEFFKDHAPLPDARAMQYRLRRLGKVAGIEKRVTPQALRHTFAANSRDLGVSPEALRRVLGIATLAFARRYFKAGEGNALELGADVKVDAEEWKKMEALG